MILRTAYFSKVDFWARELRLPLFWITDPAHNIFKAGVLVLYKANVIHMYHLDDTEALWSAEGYEYFTRRSNVVRYKKRVKEIRDLIARETGRWAEVQVSALSTAGLRRAVFELIGVLDAYSNTYTKTEPIALSRIESQGRRHRTLIRELGEMRFVLRKEGEVLFHQLFGVFIREAAKRFGVQPADLFLYTFNEMKGLFRGHKVQPRVLAARRKGYAVICLRRRRVMLTGERFKRLYRDVVLAKTKTDQLEGRVAMAGKTKGRVRVIVHNRRNIGKEVSNFREGEILVTEMTRPDTILACRKASAIITDEGGMTSHAAIISRELRIPCIVATKNATQVLKTGDVVEVDATAGTVKIVKTSLAKGLAKAKRTRA